jgi:hypothetical protein
MKLYKGVEEVYPRPQWLKRTETVCQFKGAVEIGWMGEGCEGLAGIMAEELRERGIDEVRVGNGSAGIVVGLLEDREMAVRLDECGVEVPEEVRRSGGYVLSVTADGAVVAGFDAAGAFYGVQSLLQVIVCEDGAVSVDGMEVRDWPFKEVRGIHLYMPGREQIPFFKRLVAWLARMKYNALFLEIGAGMEFERHPAINEAWVEFAETVAGFPGGQRGVQASQPYVKSSVHIELAQGSWLRKEEVADLVAWARAHHVEIIPEVCTLSHSYYLCLAYPEIAEREDDPYPDTYCPSNPRTYEILFDVLEEVIEVFAPRLVHIGHDEVVHLGHCPRCQGKSGAELLAGDVARIHEFLAERGVRTGMWGDKLLPLATGGRFGGGMAMDGSNSYWGRANSVPATYQALEEIPRDVLISNWYWSIDPEASSVFMREGFEVVLGNFGGNFAAQKFDRWQEYGTAEKILGAEVSTWCEVSEFAFGYNGCFFNMIFAAQMLWWSHFRDLDREMVNGEVARQTRLLREEREKGREGEGVRLPQVGVEPPFGEWMALPEDAGVVGVDRGQASAVVEVDGVCESLRFLHGCATEMKRQPTWSFEDPGAYPEEDLIGAYWVRYADGEEIEVPIYYGTHVARWDVPYGERVDAVPYWADPVPAGRDGAGRRITLYSFEWVNPRPEVTVVNVAVEYRGDEGGGLWLVGLERLERVR